MSELLGKAKHHAKTSASQVGLFFFKLISFATVGLTISLIGQETFSYGELAILFVTIVFTGFFLSKSRAWSYSKVFIFDVVCVLVGFILKMYIIVGPGA